MNKLDDIKPWPVIEDMRDACDLMMNPDKEHVAPHFYIVESPELEKHKLKTAKQQLCWLRKELSNIIKGIHNASNKLYNPWFMTLEIKKTCEEMVQPEIGRDGLYKINGSIEEVDALLLKRKRQQLRWLRREIDKILKASKT